MNRPHLPPPLEQGTLVPNLLKRAILITVIFMIIEIAGGYFASSLALYSDAAHMLTDVGAMLLSLFAHWMSKRPSTPFMSFGYHRAEILGALTSGLMIWLLAGLLIYEALLRFENPPPVKGFVVLIIATLGLVANLLSMTILAKAKQSSMNVRAAYVHLFADSLGSIAAIVAGLVIWLTGWTLADLIVSILFAVLMLVGSWELVKESVSILMESTPSGVNPKKVYLDLTSIHGVREVHDLHIWTVASGRLALSVHLISEDSEQKLLHDAHQILKENYAIFHTTIQIEHPSHFSSERCYDCHHSFRESDPSHA